MSFKIATILALLLHIWAFSRIGVFPFILALFLAGFLEGTFSKKTPYLILLLVPLANALAWFLPVKIPFNYLGFSIYPVVGYLLGQRQEKGTVPYYSPFLALVWSGAFFLLLRWSNLTLSPLAFLKNTPVAPDGPRFSFGILLLAWTLLLWTAGPLGYHFFKEIEQKKALKVLSIATSISLAVGLVQKSGTLFLLPSGPWKWIHRFNGTFSDPNAAGIFSAALFSWIVLRAKNFKEALWSLPPLGMLLLSSSRTGLIMAALALIFFTLDKSKPTKFKLKFYSLFFLLFLISLPHLWRRMERYIKNPGNTTLLTEGRNILYSRALKALETAPLSGVGPGNFIFFVMAKYNHPKLNDVVPSVYLGVAAELGFAGVLAFTIFLIPFLLARPGPEKKVFTLFLIAFLMHSALWSPEVVLLFFFLLSKLPSGKLKWEREATALLTLTFLLGNILYFQKLHPAHWCLQKGKPYFYGLYAQEGNFRWTAGKAGIYFSFEKPLVLKSGFPFEETGITFQQVKVFWRGKKLRTIIFDPAHRRAELKIRGTGFLEFRVSPTFAPAKVLRSKDKRVLGVKIFGTW